MGLALNTKHSLSNQFEIDVWQELNLEEYASFLLSDANTLLIRKSDLNDYYHLHQDVADLRIETAKLLTSDLNQKYQFQSCEITGIAKLNEEKIFGYVLKSAFIESYVLKVDGNLGEKYFPVKQRAVNHEINVNAIPIHIDYLIGTLHANYLQLKKSEIFTISPKFRAVCGRWVVFDFLLGINEIIVLKKGQAMSIEQSIGEPLIEDTSGLGAELEVSLGSLSFSIPELQTLVVGDFVSLKGMSVERVEIKMRSKVVAIGELIYNEHNQLALEVKEVFL